MGNFDSFVGDFCLVHGHSRRFSHCRTFAFLIQRIMRRLQGNSEILMSRRFE